MTEAKQQLYRMDMIKTAAVILMTISIGIGEAQTECTRYYSDRYLNKEVTAKKAKFSETVIKSDDLITTEVKNLKKNIIIRRTIFKGEEPYGIWIYPRAKGPDSLDYNFEVKYSDERCVDSLSSIGLNNYLEDNDSLDYVAPKIGTGETSVLQFLTHNIVFPYIALEKRIFGTVFASFSITEEGNIENIIIEKGANIVLGKEVVRVLKLLKFSNPPMLNGKPQRLCVILPVTFNMK